MSSVRSESTSFPSLPVSGPAFDPKTCIEPGTGPAVTLGYFLAGLGVLLLVAVTWGVALIALLFSPLINWINRRKALALIHGSGIKVGPNQFSQIDECAQAIWERIGRGDCPDIYIIEASVINAFAVRYGKRNVVLLTDDMVHGCLRTSDPRTLVFVLAHELAHATLNHNTPFRVSMGSTYKRLSRLDEYTADRVAMKIVDDQTVSAEAIVLLTVGPHLLKYINFEELEVQVEEVRSNSQSKKAEKDLSHPLLLNRLSRALDGDT